MAERKNLNAQSFEQALAGKEVDRYETLKNRPGLIERYIPSQRVAARREDEIALQTGDREYVRIQEALSVDNGKGFIIFLDPEKIIMSIVRMKRDSSDSFRQSVWKRIFQVYRTI